MKNIVISADYRNLKSFLKNEKRQYQYVSFNLDCIDLENFLKEKGYRKVEINTGTGGIDFAKEYVDFIGKLNRDYNSLYWWATTISYKGRFGSDLCTDIFNYYCAISLIKKQNHGYIILSNNPVFNNCIKKYCDENRIDFRLLDAVKKETRIVYFLRFFKSSTYFLCQGWMRKLITFIYLSKDIKRSLKKKKPYYIIRSWIDKRSFLGKDGYEDLYFGSLPEYSRHTRQLL